MGSLRSVPIDSKYLSKNVFVSLLLPSIVIAVQTIYFASYPGYVNLRYCARECMDGFGAAAAAVRNNVICSTNDCLCGHGQEALSYIQSCALSRLFECFTGRDVCDFNFYRVLFELVWPFYP